MKQFNRLPYSSQKSLKVNLSQIIKTWHNAKGILKNSDFFCSLLFLFVRGPSLSRCWTALYQWFHCRAAGSQCRGLTSCFAFCNLGIAKPTIFFCESLCDNSAETARHEIQHSQAYQEYCESCDFFLVKAPFSEILALNLLLSFLYYNRKAHISLNVSRGKLKITPTVSRSRANRAQDVLYILTTKCSRAEPEQTTNL